MPWIGPDNMSRRRAVDLRLIGFFATFFLRLGAFFAAFFLAAGFFFATFFFETFFFAAFYLAAGFFLAAFSAKPTSFSGSNECGTSFGIALAIGAIE